MKRVLVNGGAGFIGHHLCIELKKHNYEPIAIDRMDQLKYHDDMKYYKAFVKERLTLLDQHDIDLITVDTNDSKRYKEVLEEHDPIMIYHMNAIASAIICQRNPSWAFSENLANVEKILECIRTTNPDIRFVFSSSSVAYGEFEKDYVTEETPLRPINVYGLTKKNSEELIQLYNKNFSIPYAIIRPSALYGPRCVNRRVSQIMIENILENKPIYLFDGGKEKLDFSYVDDTVQGFFKAGTSPNGLNQIFNITYGEARPVSQLVDVLEDYFPNIEVLHKKRDTTMPKRGTLKVDKARKLIGYEPENPIEIGYKKYIEWYLEKKDYLLKRS